LKLPKIEATAFHYPTRNLVTMPIELPRLQIKNIGVPQIKLEVTIELCVFLKFPVVSVIKNNKHLYRIAHGKPNNA